MARLPVGDSLADDPGLYWIVGPIMRATGIGDPRVVVWVIALAAFAFAVAVQRGWYGRLLLTLSAPLVIGLGAAYWVPAWALWVGLGASPVGSGIVGIVAGLFRSTAALPLIAWSFRRPKVGALVLVAWLGVSALIPTHLLWHTIYIGLGWYPNPYGIEYRDESGMAATKATYASPEYEAALKAETTRIALADPGFVLGTEARKAIEAIRVEWPWILIGCLAVWRRRSLAVPFALAFAPMVLAVPIPDYAGGLVAFGLAGLGCGDDARVLGRERVPTRVRREQREQQPRGVVVRPRAGES
jgi:hypothetical protein